MTGRDLTMRGAGAALIGAGCGASLWLRSIMPGQPQDPTLLQFVLVVASFVLTLGGALLVLNGDKLAGRRPPRPTRPSHWDRQSIGPIADDRAILADILARRARRNR